MNGASSKSLFLFQEESVRKILSRNETIRKDFEGNLQQFETLLDDSLSISKNFETNLSYYEETASTLQLCTL